MERDRLRLVATVSGNPSPGTVNGFCAETGVRVIAAIRVFGAAPDREGTRFDCDGTLLVFEGVSGKVGEGIIEDHFGAQTNAIGMDITGKYIDSGSTSDPIPELPIPII